MKIEKQENGKLKISGIKFYGNYRHIFIKDFIGMRFGRLLAVAPIPPDYSKKWGDNRRWMWLCKCDCGNEVKVFANNLGRNHSTSCGCYNREQMTKSVTKHGLGHTVEYHRWFAMVSRCHRKNNVGYKHYNKRGRTVCERWRNDFEAFLEDIGKRPDGLTLERGDNNEGYHCGKCEECISKGWIRNGHWDTWLAQSINKENTPRVNYEGQSVTLYSLAERFNIPVATLKYRLKRGIDLHSALTTKKFKNNQYTKYK